MSAPRPDFPMTCESRRRWLSISGSRSLCDIAQQSVFLWPGRGGLTRAPSSMHGGVSAGAPQSQPLTGHCTWLQPSPTLQFQGGARGTSHGEPIGQCFGQCFRICGASPELPPISGCHGLTVRTASFQAIKASGRCWQVEATASYF